MGSTAQSTIAHKFGGTSVASAERMQGVAKLLRARDDAHAGGGRLGDVGRHRRADQAGRAGRAARSGLERGLPRSRAQAPRGRTRAARRPPGPDRGEARERLRPPARPAARAQPAGRALDRGDGLYPGARRGVQRDPAGGVLQRTRRRHRLPRRARGAGGAPRANSARVVDWGASAARLAEWRKAHTARRVVVTGFIARDARAASPRWGATAATTPARSSGRCSTPPRCTSGPTSTACSRADPRLVPEAVLIARAVVRRGLRAGLLRRQGDPPADDGAGDRAQHPARIRNTFKPEHPGTPDRGQAATDAAGEGRHHVRQLAMLNIEGAGMIGVPGTAERVFGALHRAGVSVVMISQGSSEHSICCVVEEGRPRARSKCCERGLRARARPRPDPATSPPSPAPRAGGGGRRHGRHARRRGAAVRRAGARAASTCARSRRARPSGTSRWRSTAARRARALRAVHAGFYLSAQTISVGVIGPGQRGPRAAAARSRRRASACAASQPRPAGARDRRQQAPWCWASRRSRSTAATAQLDGAPAPGRPRSASPTHVHAEHLPHAVIIDCSRQRRGGRALRRLAGARHPRDHAQQARRLGAAGRATRRSATRRPAAARFRYEATVGAGLPVITTLRDLIDTGDEVLRGRGHLLAARWRTSSTASTAAALLDAGRAKRGARATPSPIRATISPAATWRASWSSSRARRAGAGARATSSSRAWCPAALRGGTRDEFLRACGELDAPMEARLAAAPRAATCCATWRGSTRRRGEGRPGRAAADARLRPHPADRQRGAVHHPPLPRQPAGGAGPGRRPRSDGGGRVRRPAARRGASLGARL